jgi:hypothetical protein
MIFGAGNPWSIAGGCIRFPQASISSFSGFQIPVTSRVDSGKAMAGGSVAAWFLGDDCTKSIVSSMRLAPSKGVTKRSFATSFDLVISVQQNMGGVAARFEPFAQSLRLNRFE